MGQEFVIKSTVLEDKINQLLPSQGGQQAGVDLSASTTIIPIVDLTESAEGSGLRQDLQQALSLTSVTSFAVNNTTTTIINTTGYFRIFGCSSITSSSSAGLIGRINLTDGTTTKSLIDFVSLLGSDVRTNNNLFDFIVFLAAGDSCTVQATGANVSVVGCSRQIADINGNLVNPL